MKKSYSIPLLVFFVSYSQMAEVRFPSLAELAQNAAEISSGNPEYEKLAPEIKRRILLQSGTLDQILNFVKQNHDYVTQDLIVSIPDKLWIALLNESITIQSFIDQVKAFSPAEQRWLTGTLAEKVLTYLSQDRATYYVFQRCISQNPPRYCMDDRLPVEFKPTGGLQSFKIKEPIIHEFNHLLVRFIIQKLQPLFLNNLEFNEETKQVFNDVIYYDSEFQLDDDLKNKIRTILDQLSSFSQIDDRIYVDVSQLRLILNNLLNKKITSVWVYNLPKE